MRTLKGRNLSKKGNSNEQRENNPDIFVINIFSIFDACVFAELEAG